MSAVATCSRGRIPAVLLLCVFTTSCGGPGNAPAPKAGTGEPQPAPASQGRLTKTQGTTPYDNVHCGLRDKAGNLWFGTMGEGAYRDDGKGFTNLTVNDGLSSNRVSSMLEDLKPATSGSAPTAVPAGTTANPFTRLIPEPNGRSTGVSEHLPGQGRHSGSAPAAAASIATTESRHRPSGCQVANAKVLKLNDVQQMLEDRTGAIWFASWNNEGVCRHDGGAHQRHRG